MNLTYCPVFFGDVHSCIQGKVIELSGLINGFRPNKPETVEDFCDLVILRTSKGYNNRTLFKLRPKSFHLSKY